MSDATKLVSKAAEEAVRDIAILYDGYHADLIKRFVQILRIHHEEPRMRSRRRSIEDLIKAFAKEVHMRRGHIL